MNPSPAKFGRTLPIVPSYQFEETPFSKNSQLCLATQAAKITRGPLGKESAKAQRVVGNVSTCLPPAQVCGSQDPGKRRKVKCIPSADPSICVGCRERHTRCRRQEYVDDDPSHNSEDSGLVRRMARMESMLEALMEKMSDGQAARSTISTPVTVAGGSKSTFRASADIDSLHGSLKLEMLRRELKTKLPCQSDLDALFTSSYGWWLIQQHMMPHLSNGDLIENDDSLNIELVSKEHPMKTARLLLCTAIAIQQLPRGASALNIPHEELLREKQDSLFSFVVQTVLSDDENMGNIEGVECFALQGLYEVNNGNLRRALLAFRKAITMAQLLGLHRIARESSMDSKREKQNHMHLWYQISRGVCHESLHFSILQTGLTLLGALSLCHTRCSIKHRLIDHSSRFLPRHKLAFPRRSLSQITLLYFRPHISPQSRRRSPFILHHPTNW